MLPNSDQVEVAATLPALAAGPSLGMMVMVVVIMMMMMMMTMTVTMMVMMTFQVRHTLGKE